MFAASSLVVAVLATYASVAVLSLSAAAPFSIVGHLPGVRRAGQGDRLGYAKVVRRHRCQAEQLRPRRLRRRPGRSSIFFASANGTQSLPQSVSITNTAKTPLKLTVAVQNAPGVTALFQNGLTTMTVAKSASVTLTSNPMVAGVIYGEPPDRHLRLERQGALDPDHGRPGAAAAHRSDRHAGCRRRGQRVVGARRCRRVSPGTSSSAPSEPPAPGSRSAALTSATSLVDQTSADGAYSYRVLAEAPGIGAPVTSDPGPVGSATSDSTAPDAPSSVNAPQYINIATGNSMSIPVGLDNNSVASDTITVTLTDSIGVSVSGHASGGSATVRVPISGLNQLADGKVTVSATAADNLGNVEHRDPARQRDHEGHRGAGRAGHR